MKKPATGNNTLVVSQLSFSHTKNGPKSINNFSFKIPSGSHVLIIGSNGSGKSTLFRVLAGLYGNYKGSIEWFGKKLTPINRENLTSKIGFLFQNPENQFLSLTCEEELYFGMEIKRIPQEIMVKRVAEVVKRLKFESILYTNPSDLSAGEKQKVAITSVLLCDPQVLLLDEPTNLLNDVEKAEIFEMINQLKKTNKQTILEISHNIERIFEVDYVLALHKGELVFFGEPKNFFQKHSPDKWREKFDLDLPFVLEMSISLKDAGLISKIIWDEKELIKILCQLKK